MKILAVEAEPGVIMTFASPLKKEGWVIESAANETELLDMIQIGGYEYDLITVDLRLSSLNLLSFCRSFRQQGYTTPILLITPHTNQMEIIPLLDAGADDSLAMPITVDLFMARCRALIRRGSGSLPVILEAQGLRLDPSSHQVSYGNQVLNLTPKEYGLIELFLRNHRRIFSPSMIMNLLWSFEDVPGENTIRSHIKGLRRKLKQAGAPDDLVETVYGVGYRLKQTLEVEQRRPQSHLLIPQPTIILQTGKRIHPDLEEIWRDSRSLVQERWRSVARAIAALRIGHLTPELQEEARREAHKLVSSLGNLGLLSLSQSLRKVEQWLALDPGSVREKLAELNRLEQDIHQELMQLPGEISEDPLLLTRQDRLLIIDADGEWCDQLLMESGNWGIHGEKSCSLREAAGLLETFQPDIVLLNLHWPDADNEALKLLIACNKRTPPLPVVVFTKEDTLSERIRIANLGGQGFLPKKAPPREVLRTVMQVLERYSPPETKIMIVDDDPEILQCLKQLLEPWGLRVKTLGDPRYFWDTLREFSPYLLILDLEIPYASGLDLCQLVRSDAHWCGLPILFLTAHRDAKTVNQVFAAGADDFVSKPIVESEIVTRVINRIERTRLLRNLVETDPMTGTLNRHRFIQGMIQLLYLADRHKRTVCLVVIKIPQLSQLVASYGYGFGDDLLRRLGQHLQPQFRREDLVARWEYDTFVVAMYPTLRADAYNRLHRALEPLHQETFFTPQHTEIKVVFSFGVAESGRDGNDLQSLYQLAKADFYRQMGKQVDAFSSYPTSPPLRPEPATPPMKGSPQGQPRRP